MIFKTKGYSYMQSSTENVMDISGGFKKEAD